MGYYTYYNLDIEDATDEEASALNQIFEKNDLPFDYYNGDRYWCGEGTWYDHHENMLSASIQYPHILFILTGEGEERNDNWRKYYRNGKSAVSWGHIIYDQVDIP